MAQHFRPVLRRRGELQTRWEQVTDACSRALHRLIPVTDYQWWGTFQGYLLLVLNGVFYFNGEYWLEEGLHWPIPLVDDFGLQLLLYFLLSLLCCFLLGGLRGYLTGLVNAVMSLSWRPAIIGIVPIMVIYELLGFLIVAAELSHFSFLINLIERYMGDDDYADLALITLGFTYVPILGIIQMLLGAGASKSGGLIGSRLPRRQGRSN